MPAQTHACKELLLRPGANAHAGTVVQIQASCMPKHAHWQAQMHPGPRRTRTWPHAASTQIVAHTCRAHKGANTLPKSHNKHIHVGTRAQGHAQPHGAPVYKCTQTSGHPRCSVHAPPWAPISLPPCHGGRLALSQGGPHLLLPRSPGSFLGFPWSPSKPPPYAAASAWTPPGGAGGLGPRSSRLRSGRGWEHGGGLQINQKRSGMRGRICLFLPRQCPGPYHGCSGAGDGGGRLQLQPGGTALVRGGGRTPAVLSERLLGMLGTGLTPSQHIPPYPSYPPAQLPWYWGDPPGAPPPANGGSAAKRLKGTGNGGPEPGEAGATRHVRLSRAPSDRFPGRPGRGGVHG